MQAVSGESLNEVHRSGCPINLSLEVFGDKWSLLILRDMIFGGCRHFRELLSGSQEGIASNILASRLKSLVEMGILSKRDDATHKQKVIYSLTSRPSSWCRSWPSSAPWEAGGCRSPKNSPSAPDCSPTAVPHRGSASWPSSGQSTWASLPTRRPTAVPSANAYTRPTWPR
jgi:DNA-binding HxlR family transcriptional regulator